jgi:hypothetical protein
VDGLVLPVGPRIELYAGRLAFDLRATYRSHLGEVDPAVTTLWRLGETSELELVAERATYTNDAWSRIGPVNAAATLVFGRDLRNYYRATSVGIAAKRRWESFDGFIEPWVGARTEDARSVGPVPGATSHPWSLSSGPDSTHMLRPNPPVSPGRITSALVGATGEWASGEGDMLARGAGRIELAADAPGDARFAQLTLDGSTRLFTVRDHWLELGVHAVATVGDPAPPQRHAYLGGSATIPTRPPLSMGGDRLLFVEGAYMVPLPRPVVPYLGSPTIGVRYIAGSAGIDRLPRFVQNVGARLGLGLVRFDFVVDPASGDWDIGFGVMLP